MLKIVIILPYKEHYSLNTATVASLWVYDFFKHSKLKNKELRNFYKTKYLNKSNV